MSSGIVSQMFQPGGGIVLIPFIRKVIACLICVTSTAFFFGVARIHMAILTFLSGGLLWSISMFQNEFNRVQQTRTTSRPTDTDSAPVKKNNTEKTD